MRQKGISLNIRPLSDGDDDGPDDHHSSAADTPMRADAFDLDDEVKIERLKSISGRSCTSSDLT